MRSPPNHLTPPPKVIARGEGDRWTGGSLWRSPKETPVDGYDLTKLSSDEISEVTTEGDPKETLVN
jgi:hypothetical protein